MNIRRTLLVLLLVLGLGALYAQAPRKKAPIRKAPANEQEIIQEIQELESTLRAAFTDGKTAWWDEHLDDHYSGMNPDGQMVNKRQAIQLYDSGDVQYEQVFLSDISARIFNDDCVLDSGKISVKGTHKGQDFSGDYHFVNVWIKNGPDWRLASSQSTKLPSQLAPFPHPGDGNAPPAKPPVE